MKKFGILKLTPNNLNNNFTVVLETSNICVINGIITNNIKLERLYEEWYKQYQTLRKTRSLGYFTDLDNGYEPDEDENMNISSGISDAEQQSICDRASKVLLQEMRSWLDSLSRDIREELIRDIGDAASEYALIIQVSQENIYKQICRLPWHIWDLLDRYKNLEISLSTYIDSTQIQQQIKIEKIQSKVELLAIVGGDEDITPKEDINLLSERTKDSLNLTTLIQPDSHTLANKIVSQQGWNILFFAGHSNTIKDGGLLQINNKERVNINQFKNELRTAAINGLKLAIFNSCDGLGLAKVILDAGVPFAIVMRDSIPDRVAQYFLKEFIEEYIHQGRSLHTAVRIARKKIQQEYETIYPGISSHPVIVQHLNAAPPVWHELRGIESPYKGLEPFNESDRYFLLGREQALKDLKALVNVNPITFIVGEAGSGKTSLVRAGLISTLKLKEEWIVRECTIAQDYLLDALDGLDTEVQKHPIQSILIVIDKFERSFSIESKKQDIFLEKLDIIGNYKNVKILVLSNYSILPVNDRLLKNYPYLNISDYDSQVNENLAVDRTDEISSDNHIVKKPASLFGIGFEGELSDTITNDIGNIAINLSFLQFVLKELWKYARKDRLITYQAYRNLGGANGIISRYAQDCYDSIFTEDEKENIQLILMKLVRVDESNRYTCKRTNKQELFISSIPRHQLDKLIDELENSRLLRIIVEDKNIFLYISHQIILNEWIIQQDWFKTHQNTIQSIQWAEEKYHEWRLNNGSKKAKDLLRGKDLDRAKELKKNNSGLLSENAIDFIDYSIKQDASEKIKSKVGWSALLLLVMSLFGSWAIVNIPLSNELTVTRLRKDSENSLQSDTTKSLLLAISAFIRDDSFESQIALWNSFNANHERSQISDFSNSWNYTKFAPDSDEKVLTIDNEKVVLRNIKYPSEKIESIGHKNITRSATFDPNNPNRFITASLDNTAIIWNVENKKLVIKHQLKTNQPINYAAFDPSNSDRIFTVGANGSAILWNLKALDKAIYLQGHTGDIWMGVFSAKNARQLLTVSQDGTAKIWNSDRPHVPTKTLPHNLPVSYGEFSPHDPNIILTRTDREIYIWHLDKPNNKPLVLKHHNTIRQTLFNPRNPEQVISVGKDGECFSWNITTGISTLISNEIHSVNFYPNKNELFLLSIGRDKIARLWNVSNLSSPQQLSYYSLKHPGDIEYTTFNSKNPRQLLTVSNDKIVRIWDINSSQSNIKYSLDKFKNRKLITAVSLSFGSSEKNEILSINRDSTLNIWKLPMSNQDSIPHVIKKIPKIIGEVESAWFDEIDKNWIAIVNTQGLVYLWNHDSNQIRSLPQEFAGVIQAVRFDSSNPDRVLLVSDRKVGIWNIKGKYIQLAPDFFTRHLIINAEFIPDRSDSVSILDSSGQIHFWKIGGDNFYKSFKTSSEAISNFKFIPRSSEDIVTISNNRGIEKISTNNLKQNHIFSNGNSNISDISLSNIFPRILLTGDDSGVIKLRDIASPHKQLTIDAAGNKSIKMARLNPNNLNQIIALDSDGKIFLYNIGGVDLLKASLNNISKCYSDKELKEYALDRQILEKYITNHSSNEIDKKYLNKISCSI